MRPGSHRAPNLVAADGGGVTFSPASLRGRPREPSWKPKYIRCVPPWTSGCKRQSYCTSAIANGHSTSVSSCILNLACLTVQNNRRGGAVDRQRRA